MRISPDPNRNVHAASYSNMSVASSITHVIFDLDGLLLDTESLYTAATQKILDRYNKKFDWSVKSKMMGRKPMEAARVLVEALKLPLSAEEFNKELYSSLEDVFPEAQLLEGSAAIVKHLHSSGIPLALATGSAYHSYTLKVSRHKELFSCFHHVVCSDDEAVQCGKPSPDIYLVAASRFANPPHSNSEILVFEDAPNGVAAAKAAGMKCVMVPDPRTEPERCQEADRVVQSLKEVNLQEWGLPPLPSSS